MNAEKAVELINSFSNGDTTAAKTYLAADYIQHNPIVGTGREAFIEYLSAAPAETSVEIIRVFEDGDYVFLHTIYNFAGSGAKVAFDLFRFENGQIAEHWDNIENIAAPNLSGHTQTDGPIKAVDLDKTEANKAICRKFINDLFINRKFSKLIKYITPGRYTQHNIHMTDGLSGLTFAFRALSRAGNEMKYNKLHMVLGQGSFVLAIGEGFFCNAPTAYYDLWRVENGKFAEHWDIVAPIEDQSTWANKNGKF